MGVVRLVGSAMLRAAIASLALLCACSTEQVRRSEVMAVLDTSAYSPDGKFIAGGRNMGNVILIYEMPDGRLKKILSGEKNTLSLSARSLAISHDATFLAASGIDDMVVVWDLRNDQVILRFPEMKAAGVVSFSPTENTLAVSGPGNSVTLIAVPEGRIIGQLDGHTAPILSMTFSHDGKMLATGGMDRTARLWSTSDLRPIKVFVDYEYGVHSVSFSSDASMLATYSGELRILNLNDGPGRTLALPDLELTTPNKIAVAFISVRHWLLVPYLWPTRPDPVETVSRRLSAIFSPTANIIAVQRFREIGYQYEILLFDLTNNTTKVAYGQALSIRFSPDGKILAAFGTYGVESSLKLLDPLTGNWLH